MKRFYHKPPRIAIQDIPKKTEKDDFFLPIESLEVFIIDLHLF